MFGLQNQRVLDLTEAFKPGQFIQRCHLALITLGKRANWVVVGKVQNVLESKIYGAFSQCPSIGRDSYRTVTTIEATP